MKKTVEHEFINNQGRTYIKHDRTEVSMAANVACDLALFLAIKLNGDDIEDTDTLRKKYETTMAKVYGPKFRFNACLRIAKALYYPELALGVSSASGFGKLLDDITNE